MAANSMEENLENSNFETNATEESCEALVNRNYNGSINSQVKQNEDYSVQFDDILKSIGEFGSWQKIIYFLTCVFVLVPSGIHCAGVLFITGTPKFQCVTPNVECDVNKCCDNCTKYDFIGPFHSTVTEYNLICKRAFIAANVQAGFGAGMLVGSFIFGAISDIYGRRFCMLLCSLLTTLFSLGAAFSHSLVLFTLLRFGTAASLTGFYVAHYVYILELVGPSYRTMVAKCAGLFWAIGSGTVTLLAYYIRDWRTLLLVASCPPALFICLWPILPESARWLLVRGRSDEARLVVMKYVKKSSMPSDYLSSALSRCGQGAADVHTTKIRHSPLDLLRTPRMRRRTLILWFNWFVDNLIFYGFLFYISDLRGSPYLNMVYMYVVSDVPGIFLAWIAIQKFGRRVPYCVFMITGGVACLLVLAVPKDQSQITTVLAFIGRGLVTMSFSIMYLYSSELYPTSMRNLAVGVCSTVARLGSIIAPYIVMLSQLPGLSVTLPMVIFGGLAVTAGLTILWLPETLNSNMCQTLEETNLAKEYYGFIWMEKHVMNPFSFLRWSSSNEDSSLDVPVPSNETHYYADADCEEFSVENTPLMSNTKES